MGEMMRRRVASVVTEFLHDVRDVVVVTVVTTTLIAAGPPPTDVLAKAYKKLKFAS